VSALQGLQARSQALPATSFESALRDLVCVSTLISEFLPEGDGSAPTTQQVFVDQ